MSAAPTIVPPDAARRLHHIFSFADELDLLRRKLDDVILVDHYGRTWVLVFYAVRGEIERG